MRFEKADHQRIFRVGRAPDPWAFGELRYSGNNRWDDSEHNFRTIYAGDSLFSCYVEVLAPFRPDRPNGNNLLDGILEDSVDATDYPTVVSGEITSDWIKGRMWAAADLSGTFVNVTDSSTIAHLRLRFLPLAKSLGFKDFDASALKTAHPRKLTQRVASHLYAIKDPDNGAQVCGVRFASRHGDDLKLWAIFEHENDTDVSRCLSTTSSGSVDIDPEMMRAAELHGLKIVN